MKVRQRSPLSESQPFGKEENPKMEKTQECKLCFGRVYVLWGRLSGRQHLLFLRLSREDFHRHLLLSKS
jgi:hypothetical protein